MASVKAYASKLEYLTLPSTWTAVARVKSIKPSKITAKSIDTTVLDSADEFEEHVSGLASGGEVEVKAEYDVTQTATLYTLFRSTKNFRIQYPDKSGWLFTGFIDEIGDDEIVNGEIVHTSFKIKVSGKPTKSSDVTTGS